MKRFIDISLALLAICILIIPAIAIAFLVRFTSRGPVLYWSRRVGRHGKIFRMPKFRSMKIDAPEVASHLLTSPHLWLTPVGRFLRISSADEIPQIWSIVKGDMSFVGPRPALCNQYELIDLRQKAGINDLLPGLTGWAQINGRDEVTSFEKLKLDLEYLEKKTILFDLRIICLTALRVLAKKNVSH